MLLSDPHSPTVVAYSTQTYSKPRQVCELICTGFYCHSVPILASRYPVSLFFILVAYTEYFP